MSTISANTVTTAEIDSGVVDDYVSDIASYYGVETADITTSTTYETGGSMSIEIPDEVSEEELTDAIVASIAEALGVHPQDVEVIVDMDTGNVDFTVTSDSYSGAAGTQFDLDNDNYKDAIVAGIESAIPSASVSDYDVSDDITAAIEFTIDANDASNDLTQAGWQSEQLLSDFSVDIDTVYKTSAPTLVPSVSPTTSLPTASPSITGNNFSDKSQKSLHQIDIILFISSWKNLVFNLFLV